MSGAPYVHCILMSGESGHLIPDMILKLPQEAIIPPTTTTTTHRET